MVKVVVGSFALAEEKSVVWVVVVVVDCVSMAEVGVVDFGGADLEDIVDVLAVFVDEIVEVVVAYEAVFGTADIAVAGTAEVEERQLVRPLEDYRSED